MTLLTLYLVILLTGRRTNETTAPQLSTAFALIKIAVAEQTNMVNLSSADFKNVRIVK